MSEEETACLWISDEKQRALWSLEISFHDEAAAIALLVMMMGISECNYHARWDAGLSHALWKVKAGFGFGKYDITSNQAELLRILAEEAGGWWIWSDESSRLIFMNLAEFEELHRQYVQNSPPLGAV